jgi:group I intron endonuclease
MTYKIYLITNIKNKKQYVGVTKFSPEERFLQHTKRGFILTEAIKKYGSEFFSIELIVEVNTENDAYDLEKYYIEKYNTKAPNGYNLTDGGDGIFGWEMNEEMKKELSERVKELHKDKKVGMYGKKHSDETKKKMRLSAKGNKNAAGKPKSEETKQKLREKNIGKVLSEDTKKKISQNHHDVSGKNNPMYGKKHSPETIEKIKKTWERKRQEKLNKSVI